MIRLGMITVDTAQPKMLAEWWAERLNGSIISESDGWFYVVQGQDLPVNLGFQRTDTPTPGKNRMHLDLDRGADIDRATVLREWVAAGATHIEQHGESGFSWDVFSDPDGNLFCIGDPH